MKTQTEVQEFRQKLERLRALSEEIGEMQIRLEEMKAKASSLTYELQQEFAKSE